MYFERNHLFSEAQAVTATGASTDTVDLGKVGTSFGSTTPMKRNFGKGSYLAKISINVTENFNNLTSIAVSVQTDDSPAFGAATTLFTSPAYTLTQLNDDKSILLPDTLPGGDCKRYLRLLYTLVGAAPTTGKITSGIVMGLQRDY
jgi:hypothetical protein